VLGFWKTYPTWIFFRSPLFCLALLCLFPISTKRNFNKMSEGLLRKKYHSYHSLKVNRPNTHHSFLPSILLFFTFHKGNFAVWFQKVQEEARKLDCSKEFAVEEFFTDLADRLVAERTNRVNRLAAEHVEREMRKVAYLVEDGGMVQFTPRVGQTTWEDLKNHLLRISLPG